MNLITIIGRPAEADYYDPNTWEVFLREGQTITEAASLRLEALVLAETEAKLQGIFEQPIQSKQWIGWGLKDEAIAQAIIRPGAPTILVNNQPRTSYFKNCHKDGKKFIRRLTEIELVKPLLEQFSITVTVIGSSPTFKQQPKAVAHAIARALIAYDKNLYKSLRQEGYWGSKVKSHEKFI